MVLGAYLPGKPRARLADIGAGTGVLSLMMAQKSEESTIVCIENDSPSLVDLRANTSSCPFSGQLIVCEENFLQYTSSEPFDMVFSNPPFYENNLLGESDQANRAKHVQQLTLPILLKRTFELTTEKGAFWFIWPSQNRTNTEKAIELSGWFIDERITINGRPGVPKRVIYGLSKSQKDCTTNSELTIRDDQGRYTAQYVALTVEYHGNKIN